MSVIQFQSTKEFVHMLAMYKQAGSWLLPQWTKKIALTSDEYLDVRDRWESNDMVVLDFDGLLHPTRKLARMMYNVKKARSAMKFENEKRTQYYILGPVDILYLEKDGDFWSMTLVSAAGCRRFVMESLKQETDGLLVTMTLDEEGNPIEKKWQLDGSEEQESVFSEHMDLFYERKWLKKAMA